MRLIEGNKQALEHLAELIRDHASGGGGGCGMQFYPNGPGKKFFAETIQGKRPNLPPERQRRLPRRAGIVQLHNLNGLILPPIGEENKPRDRQWPFAFG